MFAADSRNTEKNKQLFESLKIYTAEETEARQEVMYENYISSLCCSESDDTEKTQRPTSK